MLNAYGDNKGAQDRGARRRREKSQIAVTVEFSRLATLRQLGEICRHAAGLVAGKPLHAHLPLRLVLQVE